MIVDSHAHVFPYLGDATGYERPDEYFAWLQRSIGAHHQPMRRASDHVVVPHAIWSESDPSPAGRLDVNFRVGRFGRFEWTKAGVDYYKQYLAPSTVENACSPDYLIAEMDYAGVDVAVLQNDMLYGKLNDYFGECARRFPGRFLLTTHIDETTLDTAAAFADLDRCVDQLGHRGIYLSIAHYWLDGFRRLVDDPDFDAFWAEVERRKLVVYWSPGASPLPGLAGYLDSCRRWCNVVDRHPGIATVVPNGLSRDLLFGERGPLPGEVRALLDHGTFYVEVLFPISRGGIEEYPYHQSLEAARYLYEQCGPRALVWGSDMPNVLRHSTYAQSLEYVRRHADFIPPADLSLILGGNLAHAFGLPA